jgi:hypothetical protein
VVRGTFSPADSAERTSWSVKTLQEHTIIAGEVPAETVLGEKVPAKIGLVRIETVNNPGPAGLQRKNHFL